MQRRARPALVPLRSAIAVLCLLIAACKVGPNYVRPEVPMRAAYLEGAPDSRPRQAARWWEEIGDPALQELIREAGERSYDLRIVVARVDETLALRGVARAGLYPPVDATAAIQRQQDSGNSLFFTEPMRYTNWRVGLESSWEVDLWGRVRREIEAATADVGAATEMLADTTRIVIAQVASEYVEVRGAERELEVLRRNLESQRSTTELTERLREEGLGLDADVARAKGLMRETEAGIPLLEARVSGGAHRLAVLTGGDAERIKELLAAPAVRPPLPGPPALGVPSDLLLARPDVRAAERELAAATARIGVETGDLFPRVTLFGRFGLDSTEATRLFDTDSISYGVGPAVRWPLLDFGAIRCEIVAQGARQRAALARYERVVAQALTEVESSIAALKARQRSRDILADAVTQNSDAFRLVEARFREGASTFLDVLDAQRRVLLVEALLVRSETQLLLDFIALARALG
jgi:NodT family efflux transporter outer membrane factor (OMF) lipoprotein